MNHCLSFSGRKKNVRRKVLHEEPVDSTGEEEDHESPKSKVSQALPACTAKYNHLYHPYMYHYCPPVHMYFVFLRLKKLKKLFLANWPNLQGGR